MVKDNVTGKFVKQPRTTEERMAELGVDFYEISVLRLVMRDRHPDFAVKVVERLYGVKVDVKALYHKLNPVDHHTSGDPVPR
jgi:hypothetical protein